VRGDDFRNPKTRIWTDDEGDQWEYDPNRREWDLRGNPDKRREAEEKDRKERGGAAGAPQPPNRPPFDSDERDAGLRESERRRVRREIEEPGAPRTETGEQPEAEAPKPKRPRRKQNRRRAASDEVATESATRRPPAPGDKPAGGQKKPSDRVNTEQEVLELEDIIQMLEGGSEPDSRSFRNVNNRFPKSGLPKSAFWRKPDYDGDDAEQLERRFSRYYDADGNINARGRVVNREIARRKREGGLTPKGRKPRKPKAEKKPKGPVSNTPADQADIPSPPPMAATEDIPEYQRLPEEYKQQARKVYEDALKDGDRRRKVQDDEVDKLIAKPEGTQKRLKLEQARDDAEMLEKVYRQSREEAEQNMRNMENVPFNEMSEGMKRTYIDYVAGAMRSRKEEEYARRRRMRIVNALGEDARNQPPDRPAPKPRDVRPPNRAPSQPSSSTATEENNPKFKELPEEAKQKARELFQTIVKARNDRNDREDIFVDNAIGRPAGAEANQILKDVLRREKEDLDRVLDEKYDARDNIAKLERDHGSYSEMSPTQQQNYIDSVAVIMRAEKDADRRKKRISKLKSAINEREAAPAPRPAGRPVPENRSDVRPRQQPNIGPQKVKADNDNKLGQYEGGLPAGKAVPIGNKGINTKEDAATFLRNGGEVRDVPDDFILFAMMRNTEGPNPRYRLSSVGGGGNVNGALRMFVDEEREKMFIIKYADGRSYAQNEDIYEILGNNIAGRMGLPVSEFRFAGPVVPNNKPGVSGHIRPVLFEHSGNLVEGTLQAARINHVEKIEPEDVIAATLLDYAVLNTDRHGGNYFLVTQNGKMHFVQIDMSLGFHAREFDPGDDFSGDGGFLTWLKSGAGGRRNDMAQMLPERVRQGRVTRAEVVRAIIKIQENLRAAEQAKRYTEFGQDVYNARGEVAKIDQGVKYVDARLKYLMEVDPNRLADIILERAI
jgi:hypothetical protein